MHSHASPGVGTAFHIRGADVVEVLDKLFALISYAQVMKEI